MGREGGKGGDPPRDPTYIMNTDMKMKLFPHSRSRNSRKGSAFYSNRSSWDFAGMFLGNQRRWLFEPFIRMVRLVTNVSTRKWHRVI